MSLNDLLLSQLSTLYGLEKESKAVLSKMSEAAESTEVRKELEDAASETEAHTKRLDEVFVSISAKPGSETCGCTAGLLRDCENATEAVGDGSVRDAAMIAMAQILQHNEIARYRTARAWAQSLKLERATTLLKQTLDEEVTSSKRLTDLAPAVNVSAAAQVLD
jgi:ferritin-like metal-binding protein YciE